MSITLYDTPTGAPVVFVIFVFPFCFANLACVLVNTNTLLSKWLECAFSSQYKAFVPGSTSFCLFNVFTSVAQLHNPSLYFRES